MMREFVDWLREPTEIDPVLVAGNSHLASFTIARQIGEHAGDSIRRTLQ